MSPKPFLVLGLTALLSFISTQVAIPVETGDLVPREAEPYPDNFLQRIRAAAGTIPGERAVAINFVKVAESHRTYAAVIEDGSEEPFISARTAFQVAFPDGTVMLDSGMDEEVHRYYGFGREEPYWQDVNDDVQAALRDAQLILITHEHGDHVAGVLRTAYRDELAPKTILTTDQVRTLNLAPQLPQIRLTPTEARDYIVVDYEDVLPVAPGIVLIKSPGHTHGHQMIYVQLDNEREFLFIGDIGWSLDNITELKLRPAATIERVGEDPQALMYQMTWIKRVMDDEGLVVVPAHDDVLLTRYAADGLLGTELR
ncbi:MAG TPA: MBL fold metallo-hydrolase [Gammaproteobacteria bacterium]